MKATFPDARAVIELDPITFRVRSVHPEEMLEHLDSLGFEVLVW